MVYISVALFSSIVVAVTGRVELLMRGIMFAIAIIASIRHLIMSVFSTRETVTNMLATLVQPALCFIASVALLPIPGITIPALGVVCVSILLGGVQILIWRMSRSEDNLRGLKRIPLFRAFILAWAEEYNLPLEDHITELGVKKELYTDLMLFVDPSGRQKDMLVVPYIHPGPFRNVGSSGLPKVLVDRLSENLEGEVLVAHGVSTHEMDLTRSCWMETIAEEIKANLPVGRGLELSSPMIRKEMNGAQASCQLFGDLALITLTLSPKSYDDLPEELGERIIDAAREMGLTAVVVDSHNSIFLGDELGAEDVENLLESAVEAMKLAKIAPKHEFLVGAARVIPEEWSLDDGMGPCGIAALALQLMGDKTYIYLAVDGNNMLSGLREKIMESIRTCGVDEAEVFTSDTHLVNAIGATSRGYSPIGERTDEEKIIKYTLEAVEAAISKMGRGTVLHSRTMVSGLTILGETGLRSLSDVVESGFKLFKRTALIVTPLSMAIAAAVIYLL
jgi:putative membrane protein